MSGAEAFHPVPGKPWLVARAGTALPAGITGARPTTVGGTPVILVPSEPANVLALRAAGHHVPAPILHTYKFPQGTYRAQRLTAAFLSLHPRAFVLSEMGTGKTRAALFAMDWLFRLGQIRRALIVTPLSTVSPVWERELVSGFGYLSRKLLVGTGRAKKYDSDWEVGIINHDGVVSLYSLIKGDPRLDLLLIDELAVFRTPKTLRTRALIDIADKVPRVWGMTGSLAPNGPLDPWPQTRIVNPAQTRTYPMSWWRRATTVKTGQFTYEPTEHAPALIAKLVSPAIRFRRTDVTELPPLTVTERSAMLSPQQKKAYEDLRIKLVHDYAAGKVVAANAGVLLSKLVQVAAGVVYDDAGAPHVVGAPDRLAVTSEVCEQAERKVLVMAGFKSVLSLLVEHLSKRWKVGRIDGDVGVRDRNELLTRFQDESDPLRVLIAHPGTMAHGLTLTEANTIIWYTPCMSRELFEQANARITRPGQRYPQLQVRIVGAPIDARVFRAILDRRLSFQAQCLSMFEELENL
jgi:hypothetical protein